MIDFNYDNIDAYNKERDNPDNPKIYYHAQKTFYKLKCFLIDNCLIHMDQEMICKLHKFIKEHESGLDMLVPLALEDIRISHEIDAEFKRIRDSLYLEQQF